MDTTEVDSMSSTVIDLAESPQPAPPATSQMAVNNDDVTTTTSSTPNSNFKKDSKICLVCEDKALGYNFNVVSCESCKAFFRRNAHKTIKGRCQGQCKVTVESRAFCKSCRLAKCFRVGMRKEMILSKEQKDQRRQKIIINKLRKKGSMDAEEIYSVSERDFLYPIPMTDDDSQTAFPTQKKPGRSRSSSASRGGRRGSSTLSGSDYHHQQHQQEYSQDYPQTQIPNQYQQHPMPSSQHSGIPNSLDYNNDNSNNSNGLIGSPCGTPIPNVPIKREVAEDYPENISSSSPYNNNGYTHPNNFSSPHHSAPSTPTPPPQTQVKPSQHPWQARSQEQIEKAINELPTDDQKIMREIMHAMEVTSFLSTSSTTLSAIPSTPEEFVNMAENFVRKMIKLGKNVAYFKELKKNDQVSLLKCSVVDAMMLRSAVNYDPFTETWSLNTSDCLNKGSGRAAGERISAAILTKGSPETRRLFMNYSKFIKSLMKTIHGDLLVLKTLIMISMFSADRLTIEKHSRVQEIQENYGRILESYVNIRFNKEPTLFARIIMRLTDLRNINEFHSNMLMSMKMDELEPLLLEIFDLPTSSDDCDNGSPDSSTVG